MPDNLRGQDQDLCHQRRAGGQPLRLLLYPQQDAYAPQRDAYVQHPGLQDTHVWFTDAAI